MNVGRDFYVYVHRRATDSRVFYVGKGRVISSEMRERISKKLTGLKQSEETIQKRKESMRLFFEARRAERGITTL